MPNYDGTGPFGDGRPGRGLGPCGRTDSVYGYGGGRRGRFFPRMNCFRNIYEIVRPLFTNDSRYNENFDKSSLEARKRALENELGMINDQLKGTDKEK
jgi:hypothetical protein